jgi:hypothetical protein
MSDKEDIKRYNTDPDWLPKNIKPSPTSKIMKHKGAPRHWCCTETGGKCGGKWRKQKPTECKGTARPEDIVSEGKQLNTMVAVSVQTKLVECINLTWDNAAYLVLANVLMQTATFPTLEEARAVLKKKRLRSARNKSLYKEPVVDLTTPVAVVAHIEPVDMTKLSPSNQYQRAYIQHYYEDGKNAIPYYWEQHNKHAKHPVPGSSDELEPSNNADDEKKRK